MIDLIKNTFAQKNRADVICVVLLFLLTAYRTLPFFFFPGIHFDSDQATFGLMGIHLSRFEAFPIFMYGQRYMLALQSWTAVPFFWMFGPSIEVMKIPTLLTNFFAVGLLYFTMRKPLSFSPWFSFLGALSIALPALSLSQQWMNVSGGHIEPMIYVIALYLMRARLGWFAAISALAFLHREYCLAAILSVWIIRGFEIGNRRILLRELGRWALGFFGLIALVHLAARFLSTNYFGSTPPFKFNHGVDNFINSIDWIGRHLALLTGSLHGIDRNVAIVFEDGSAWVGFALLVAGAASVVAMTKKIDMKRAAFAVYLLMVSGMVCGFYLLKLQSHDEMGVRYLILAAFIPVAFSIVLFGSESKWVRRLGIGVAVLISVFHLRDGARYLYALNMQQPVDVNGQVAQELEKREVVSAIAPYWKAYDISFRTGDRVHVASSELVRIHKNQDFYRANLSGSARIDDVNCKESDSFYVQSVRLCIEK